MVTVRVSLSCSCGFMLDLLLNLGFVHYFSHHYIFEFWFLFDFSDILVVFSVWFMGSCEISDPRFCYYFSLPPPLVFLSLPSSVIMFSIRLLFISCFTLMVSFLVGLVVTYPDCLVPVLSLIPSSSPTCHIFVSVLHFLCLLLLLWRCVDFCLSLVFIFLCFFLDLFK